MYFSVQCEGAGNYSASYGCRAVQLATAEVFPRRTPSGDSARLCSVQVGPTYSADSADRDGATNQLCIGQFI